MKRQYQRQQLIAHIHTGTGVNGESNRLQHYAQYTQALERPNKGLWAFGVDLLLALDAMAVASGHARRMESVPIPWQCARATEPAFYTDFADYLPRLIWWWRPWYTIHVRTLQRQQINSYTYTLAQKCPAQVNHKMYCSLTNTKKNSQTPSATP